jgi:hypothetical protein
VTVGPPEQVPDKVGYRDSWRAGQMPAPRREHVLVWWVSLSSNDVVELPRPGWDRDGSLMPRIGSAELDLDNTPPSLACL